MLNSYNHNYCCCNNISLSALLWKQLKKLIMIVGCYCNNFKLFFTVYRVLCVVQWTFQRWMLRGWIKVSCRVWNEKDKKTESRCCPKYIYLPGPWQRLQSLGQRSNYCRSRKCIWCHIPMHAMLAVFYHFLFLPVLSDHLSLLALQTSWSAHSVILLQTDLPVF